MEARNADEHLTVLKTAPHSKKTPNVGRAEAENPWCQFTVTIKHTGMHVFFCVLNIQVLDLVHIGVTALS